MTFRVLSASLLYLGLLSCAVAQEPASAMAVSSAAWQAQIAKISGSVQFKESGDDEWSAVQLQMPLEQGDMLKTGSDGSVRLILDGEAVVELGSSTVLTVRSLGYSASAIDLKQGSLLGKIKNLFSRQRAFEVRTPAAVCAVRGTEFAVEHEADSDETVAGVFDDGELAVGWTDSPSAELVSLKVGREAVIGKSGRIRAEGMRRLAARKNRMARLRADLPALQKGWKQLAPRDRAALRGKMLKRRAETKAQGVVARAKREAGNTDSMTLEQMHVSIEAQKKAAQARHRAEVRKMEQKSALIQKKIAGASSAKNPQFRKPKMKSPPKKGLL